VYKKILVLLDGSKRAETILPYVEDMALARDSTVILLQVIEPSATMVAPYDMAHYYDAGLAEKWIEEARDYLDSVQRDFRQKGIRTETLIAQGPVVKSILDVAEQENAELIAMASHGRTGLASVFYGSKAAGVLQQIDRPLLLVRVGEKDR
jgi:nucleotide-binding universal stress UspA family protein